MSGLVSIVTPFYNASEYLKEAVESVLNQDYENWELILVDDGSTDDYQDILAPFLKDSRIYLFVQTNQGVSSARNNGINQIKGDYLCFLDADDTFPKSSVSSRVLKSIETGAHCIDGVVYSKSKGKVVSEYRPSYKGLPSQELIRLTGTCFFGPTWLVKVSEKLIKFNTGLSHAEDLLFYIENFGDETYDYVDVPVLNYRVDNVSAMSNIKGLELGYKKLYSELKNSNYGKDADHLIFKYRVKKFMILDYVKRVDIQGVVRMLLW
ncbi:glycosyltransferase family 2 protein [Cyclobacteriaceae bacterium]|nr:glycosyltransferase family 2 protein [Cyclobacteriaceae bacterium]